MRSAIAAFLADLIIIPPRLKAPEERGRKVDRTLLKTNHGTGAGRDRAIRREAAAAEVRARLYANIPMAV